jgi:hypothetical protein
MASKKKAGLPVVKHKVITIRSLGSRTARELEDEVRQAAESGFKVYAFRKLGGGGVEVQLGKTEEWSIEDFMTELKEMLEEGHC